MSYLGGPSAVEQWNPIVNQAAADWGVPVEWIKAVIQVESGGNPDAFNRSDPGGSRGLMQISGPTARAYGVEDLDTLFDPVLNIAVGTHLLSDLRRSYGDDFRRVYSAYNSGGPDKWTWSAQVAANVERALGALAGYAGEVFEQAGAWVDENWPPADSWGGNGGQVAEGASWPILAAGIGLLFLVSGKRRR